MDRQQRLCLRARRAANETRVMTEPQTLAGPAFGLTSLCPTTPSINTRDQRRIRHAEGRNSVLDSVSGLLCEMQWWFDFDSSRCLPREQVERVYSPPANSETQLAM